MGKQWVNNSQNHYNLSAIPILSPFTYPSPNRQFLMFTIKPFTLHFIQVCTERMGKFASVSSPFFHKLLNEWLCSNSVILLPLIFITASVYLLYRKIISSYTIVNENTYNKRNEYRKEHSGRRTIWIFVRAVIYEHTQKTI